MKVFLLCNDLIWSATYQYWGNWYPAKGKIRQRFKGCLCPSRVRWVYFLCKSAEFHDMRTECQRKSFSFISYYIYFSITTQSLTPTFSCSPITHYPIPCSLIAPSAALPPRLRSTPPDHSLPNRSLAPTHPVRSILLSKFLPDRLIALPLIFEK